MKKVLLATALVTLSGFFISANAGKHVKIDREIKHVKIDREMRRQLHKERREERKELWLHSVNVVTENQFYMDFPNAKDVSWKESEYAEANFLDADGIVKTAYYDDDNKLVGTTTRVDFSVLPEKAQKFISKKYPDYTVEKVILFDDNEANETDMFLFGSSFEDKDVYFPVLTKGTKQLILQVSTDGDTSFFRELK